MVKSIVAGIHSFVIDRGFNTTPDLFLITKFSQAPSTAKLVTISVNPGQKRL